MLWSPLPVPLEQVLSSARKSNTELKGNQKRIRILQSHLLTKVCHRQRELRCRAFKFRLFQFGFIYIKKKKEKETNKKKRVLIYFPLLKNENEGKLFPCGLLDHDSLTHSLASQALHAECAITPIWNSWPQSCSCSQTVSY